MAKFKQRCIRCKKNMVLMGSSRQTPVCITCEMKDVDREVEDPIFKKLFDIPREFYEETKFLRSIRSNFHKFKSLTKNQVEAFEKIVKEMKKEKKKKTKTKN